MNCYVYFPKQKCFTGLKSLKIVYFVKNMQLKAGKLQVSRIAYMKHLSLWWKFYVRCEICLL